ncbi:MAG TPA: UDP-N-acetylmuramoyl-L-alanyl-D-glutamate--2,6-diaminopimelate ligase [Steroidobacteraceae bacterium]
MDRNLTPAKNLRTLFAGLGAFVLPDIEIADLTLDSRKVQAGGAFVALPGLRSHGLEFAAEAVSRGASVILWEPRDGVSVPALPHSVHAVPIPGLSGLIGTIADRFFDAPSQSIAVAAVTGTNGKTTTAYVLAAALAYLGKSSAYAGTLGYGPIGAVKSGTHTTPDSITLQRELAELRAAGTTHLAIEVSSHALDQQRVAGVRLDTAVFTNLTRDHLDYHGTLEAYGAAKAKLFAWPGLKHAVINVDDAFGRELAASHRNGALIICSRSSSTSRASLPSNAGYLHARGVVAGSHGLDIDIESNRGSATLRSRFVGDFNVDNVLAVLGVLLGWGFSLEQSVEAVEHCAAPPGRMETFAAPGQPLAIVDYAHTPDALEKALLAARQHSSGKLVCVFGCGGDRDAGKRPLMGAIAERVADIVIVTDDNPRTEDGDVIVADIVKGCVAPEQLIVERDRAAAIERAIRLSTAADVVLIAGKGHEDHQIVGLEQRYFSDRDVVTAALGRNS